jgi:lactoylglutathione lyase
MIRIKDPEASLKFYQDVMGMELKRTHESQNGGFNLYFLGYGPPAPPANVNGVNPVADREGLLELTWNYGTENDPNFKYHDGNAQPQGFGHICVAVDDLDAACARFEEKKVNWKKRLTDGRMKNVAFVLGMCFAALCVSTKLANWIRRSRWVLDRDCPEREAKETKQLVRDGAVSITCRYGCRVCGWFWIRLAFSGERLRSACPTIMS